MYDHISNDALFVWVRHFHSAQHKFRVGGKGAPMQATERTMDAIEDLLQHGCIAEIAPDSPRPDREHYGSTGADLRQTIASRLGDMTFEEWMEAHAFPILIKADQAT